jgi:hypothetical protein
VAHCLGLAYLIVDFLVRVVSFIGSMAFSTGEGTRRDWRFSYRIDHSQSYKHGCMICDHYATSGRYSLDEAWSTEGYMPLSTLCA